MVAAQADVRGGGADEDFELAGFEAPVVDGGVVEGEGGGREFDGEIAGFAGIEDDARRSP